VSDCRAARSITATLGLSGRAGEQRLRGNVDAGFEAPEKVRLEMRAPIGRPVFILAADGPSATLYLPRDHRVLRDAPASGVIEALVGLSLDGADLRAIISGCGLGVDDPAGGHSYAGGWVAADTGSARTYLRQIDGRWRIVAATRPGLTVHYADFANGRPSRLRLQAPASRADVAARLSDVEVNVTLERAAFTVDVPADAEPLTLEELRRAGPLGGQ
jgi:outer membrane biogenesis lipoprotein LolB